ncbi:class I SAM-dependent methyltransferase [Gorillibacterium massiliense]|uniref:class I SAM-dependent methyltransferase n=1 Tax=Gorillibacterium massiliense TaxID=1280390 RepID=UPI0004AF7E87|nr:methyltransferase domain-containing protein [Gorillibacterium massiliense]
MDMEEMQFPDRSFDTIVSTLSMCSYERPSVVLEKINRWCKPDGQILLMEHGISTNLPLSLIQRTLDPLLHRTVGCHFTRNIPALVHQSGIEIVSSESRWMNMVHLIRGKPGEV